ncbi:HAD-IIB family hydrolase [Marinagarivorans cellulosilyticus]|uniref:Mannosyl-3-phosphoglycerate phosphatase n=1 Tax=Marinagarivorans cellulosilyticus TaxID=2721545 RepID=A0AAN1WJW7_9GAMM|nr:HAD-IIB family hydrolase [Marinagarivorans cellulosilyticus]BCD98924.1 mannosyl-3-phosphoglycerate phosphatase [Marinagarivorans cellulosilyticus]
MHHNQDQEQPFIIVSDLDGTLLDHHDYSWHNAKPALEEAKRRQIPVVPCTSKTFSETLHLIKDIGLETPIICENGSGIALPEGKVIDLAPRYPLIIEKLQLLKRDSRFQFWGFHDMSIEEVARQTGLSIEEAANAKDRRYSEPFLWQGKEPAFDEFERAAKKFNIDIVQGGRFYHALSRGVSKQRAINHLLQVLHMPNAHVIALGDSTNDVSMLTKADTAVVVNNPTRDFPALPAEHQNIHYTSAYGPAGWNSAIMKILENNHG